jgi:type II secretory pathway pseudopilin PulG
MQLRGQQGYAMAVLMVGMAILAILMTAAMPVWRQASQREKEEELVFRGQQYVRAIKLFSQKAGPSVLPPSVEVLVSQKFLRKKFKDPITGLDFDLLGATQTAAPGSGRGGPAPPGSGAATRPSQPAVPANGTPGGPGGTPQSPVAPATAGTIIQGRGGAGANGIIGVASKSKETSIRIFNGRTHYNEWPFVYVQQVQQPGTAAPGPGGAPQRGGPQRGGAGQPGRGGAPNGRPGQPPPGGVPRSPNGPGAPGRSPQR